MRECLPFRDADAARAAVRNTRFCLSRYFSDAVLVQELLLIIICAKLLTELPDETGTARREGGRSFKTAPEVRSWLSRAFRWLEKVTKEPWPATLIPGGGCQEIGALWGSRAVLFSISIYDGSQIIRAIFDEIATPAGSLLPGSRFGRDRSKIALLDAIVFNNHSKRFHALGATLAKSFAQLSLLKQRNLDYMRGNHKRGDLVLSNYPKLIHVELATACNLRCRTCSITRPGRDRDRTFITFETLRRLRPALPFISDCKLHGGGEPFLHPQIEQVLEVFREEGVRLNTVTNANLITERLGRLIGETFSTLTVSVDGVDKETYEYVRLRSKWEKLLRGLENINRFRAPELKLIIGVVMLKCNIHQLPDLVRFAKEHGAQELQAAWLVPFHDLPWTQDQGLTDEPERTNAFMVETREVGKELGISVRIPNDLPLNNKAAEVRLNHKDTYWNLHGTTSVEGHCRLMYDRAMILVDGRVKPCGQSRTVPELGSIHNRPFESCWNGEGYQTLRRTFNSGTLPRTCMSCNFIRSNQTGTARLVYS